MTDTIADAPFVPPRVAEPSGISERLSPSSVGLLPVMPGILLRARLLAHDLRGPSVVGGIENSLGNAEDSLMVSVDSARRPYPKSLLVTFLVAVTISVAALVSLVVSPFLGSSRSVTISFFVGALGLAVLSVVLQKATRLRRPR